MRRRRRRRRSTAARHAFSSKRLPKRSYAHLHAASGNGRGDNVLQCRRAINIILAYDRTLRVRYVRVVTGTHVRVMRAREIIR